MNIVLQIEVIVEATEMMKTITMVSIMMQSIVLDKKVDVLLICETFSPALSTIGAEHTSISHTIYFSECHIAGWDN